MTRGFNITLIQPTGYVHAHALDDAADYLVAVLGEAGYRASRSTNHFDAAAINVILCGHLLGAQHLALLPADTIVFNSEGLADPTGWPFASGVYRRLLARGHVWDYSHANLPHLGHDRVSVIPFGHCAALIRPVAAAGPAEGLLFYGVITPRRRVLLDALQAAGVRLDVVFGEYGAQRDVRLRRAVAVLNLHKTDDRSTFQPIRCFYPLIQQVPVISEDTPDPTAEPFRAAIRFIGPDAFVADVAAALADREALRARARRFAETSAVPAIRAAVSRYLASS